MVRTAYSCRERRQKASSDRAPTPKYLQILSMQAQAFTIANTFEKE